jgi:hypothetical protein
METADKQSFWLIEKVLFESAFIHSHLLAFFNFNIETGDYEIKSDCAGYEDIEKAFELINTAWAMWIRAKQNAVPKGFVLVPKVLDEDQVRVIWEKIELGIKFEDPNEINDFYKAMIEATEGE